MADIYSAHPFSIEALTSTFDPKSLVDISATEFQSALLDVTSAEDSIGSSLVNRRTPDLGSDGTSPATSPSTEDYATSPRSSSSSSPGSIKDTVQKLENTANIVSQSAEKPNLSFVALIAQAILSSPDKRMLLGDIYRYISEKYAYFRNSSDQRPWRNSIRHNLSINDCFIKDGKLQNKGNYWAIHPACQAEFARGDYRRRQTKRRTRRYADIGYSARLSLSAMDSRFPASFPQIQAVPSFAFTPYQQPPMYATPPPMIGHPSQYPQQPAMDSCQQNQFITSPSSVPYVKQEYRSNFPYYPMVSYNPTNYCMYTDPSMLQQSNATGLC